MSVHFLSAKNASASNGRFMADIHVHTKYSMDCATKPHLLYKMAKKQGIGLGITDHNDIRGVKAMLAYKDITTIPGIEVTSKEWKDILLYFDSLGDLEAFYERIKPHKANVNRMRMNKVKLPMEDILDKAAKHNATVSVPHPFAIKNTYKFFTKPENQHMLKAVDAIEVANGTMTRQQNMASYGWASLLEKPMTGGSDSHIYPTVGGIVTACHGRTPQTFLAEIRSGSTQVFGLEQRKHIKLVSSINMLKNRLLRSKRAIKSEKY